MKQRLWWGNKKSRKSDPHLKIRFQRNAALVNK